jgi:hypothetical protein
MEASMRILSLAFCLFVLSTPVSAAVERPWEISLGPEKVLWVAEPMDSGVNPLDLDAEMKSAAHAVDETFAGKPRDDVLGLAFPTEFGTGADHDFVYVAFAYDSGTSGAVADRRSRIVKYQWDAEAGTLSDPIELHSGLPAGQKE